MSLLGDAGCENGLEGFEGFGLTVDPGGGVECFVVCVGDSEAFPPGRVGVDESDYRVEQFDDFGLFGGCCVVHVVIIGAVGRIPTSSEIFISGM